MIHRFLFMAGIIACSTYAHQSVRLFIASSAPIALPAIYYKHLPQDNSLLNAYTKGFAWGALPPTNIVLASWIALRTYPGCSPQKVHDESTLARQRKAKKLGFVTGLFSYLMIPFLIKRM